MWVGVNVIYKDLGKKIWVKDNFKKNFLKILEFLIGLFWLGYFFERIYSLRDMVRIYNNYNL